MLSVSHVWFLSYMKTVQGTFCCGEKVQLMCNYLKGVCNASIVITGLYSETNIESLEQISGAQRPTFHFSAVETVNGDYQDHMC